MFAHNRVAPEQAVLREVLDQCDHGMLIEAAAGQVGVLPGVHLQHLVPLGGGGIDTGILQMAETLLALLFVRDLEDLLARVKAFLQERQHDFVFVLAAMEERADVTTLVDDRSC
jgi:hypothetical protein